MSKTCFLLAVLLGVLLFIVDKWCCGYYDNSYTICDQTLSLTKKVTVTCYQPVESQCDSDPLVTADGSKIDLKELKNGSLKWCAVSRDLLKYFPEGGPKAIHIKGYGIYEVKDVMNKKWKDRVDILIHPDSDFRIKEENVEIEILQ